MLQYKTTVLPNIPYTGVKKKVYINGLSAAEANKAVAPLGQAIQTEAKGGWKLESIEFLPQNIVRKKTFLELILGWIPILGNWLFPSMKDETRKGKEVHYYILVFSKEV